MAESSKSHNPKDTPYVNGYHSSVIKSHQWRSAENSCPHLLPTLKEMVQADPALSIIDIGCGSGSITVGLASYVPHGTVTAFDLSETALAPARAAAEAAKATNMHFATGSVLSMPYPDNTFDVVHASQMLIHLGDRDQGLREMMRVCKPGGVVAVRDMCLESWTINPEPKWWQRWYEILLKHIDSMEHVRHNKGSQLLEICLRIGLDPGQVKNSASCWVWAEAGERLAYAEAWYGRTLKSDLAEWALKEGVATKEELQEIAEGWVEWGRNPVGWLGVMNAEVLIMKK
ncbi:S-adenosyl-L-methionine-dependent methyltransferase [Myriangium duriaei CBS 260.36]|uniref:S-adenosyl-L-methionine-dependent methyltransferase n=1 Tax=Myriangium duriaei CBS 260.36 TaxID=1168546 RepID=A0A9P4J2J9_9PEZI|nr:S-adenosyl-L-methionine-dependent methyltransferase [Myriangium duriaei CBS 260.36]